MKSHKNNLQIILMLSILLQSTNIISNNSFLRNVVQTKNVFADFTPIKTERLVIRKIENYDLDNLFSIMSNPEVINQTAAWELHKDRQETAQLIEKIINCYKNNTNQDWAIFAIAFEKEPRKLIGTCGYFFYSPLFCSAELGYVLSQTYWGKGIATEASRALVNFGFTSMGLNRIQATVYPENIGSVKVLEKLGMKYEGQLRQHILRNDVFRDRAVYSLLKSDLAK